MFSPYSTFISLQLGENTNNNKYAMRCLVMPGHHQIQSTYVEEDELPFYRLLLVARCSQPGTNGSQPTSLWVTRMNEIYCRLYRKQMEIKLASSAYNALLRHLLYHITQYLPGYSCLQFVVLSQFDDFELLSLAMTSSLSSQSMELWSTQFENFQCG